MRAATRNDYRKQVVAVVAYLVKHLDDAPDLATLARIGGFSPFWFHRIFVAAVGETPAEISRRIRLERAAWHLRTTDASLTDIALQAGFCDQPAFTKAFRQSYGAPPGRFRSEQMPAHEIPSLSEVHFSPFEPFYRIDLPNLDDLTMNLEFVELEPRHYVFLPHKGPYPEIGATFQRAGAIVGPLGLIAQPDAVFVGVYHDDPGTVAPENLTSDAGLTVNQETSTPSGMERGELAGGKYAKGIHKGSFEHMGDSWGKLMAAIHQSNATIRPVSPFELYISDMDTTPVDELITELYVAVEG